MRTVAYLRVSTEEQAASGQSLDAQRAKCEAYAALYDCELVEVIEDAGQSAKSLNRPGLARALDLLRTGQADALLIVKLDRLTRSVSDWQTLIDHYFGERAGKQLLSVADSIDTRTAAGRLVLNVLLSVAQWEREAIAERTRDTLRHKIANGERVGKVRYGYSLADDGRTLIEEPEEQRVIELIGELRAAGESLRAIARELTRRGVATKEGGTWAAATVSRIVKRAA